MVDYAFLIALAVFVLVAVVAFNILKGILKTVVTLIALAAIIMGVLGFLVIMDSNSLKDNFNDQSNIYLLTDNGKAISGIEVAGDEKPGIVDQQQLEEYTELLGEKDYAEIKGDNYKLIIISSDALSPADVEKMRTSGYMEERATYLVAARNKVFSSPLELITEYRKGNVIVYEETPVFKAIRLIPSPVIRLVAEKLVVTTKQVVADGFSG